MCANSDTSLKMTPMFKQEQLPSANPAYERMLPEVPKPYVCRIVSVSGGWLPLRLANIHTSAQRERSTSACMC